MSDESTELENKVWAHLGWLASYVQAALDGESVRDALLYAERQLLRLNDDFAAYQKLMEDRVHYAEGTAELALRQQEPAPTPPLLSQEEAFQRAMKAGLFAGLVSKPED